MKVFPLRPLGSMHSEDTSEANGNISMSMGLFCGGFFSLSFLRH